jgi:hypothetical protein
LGFVYNALQTFQWYNPIYARELEEQIKELRDQFPNTESVVVGDLNSRVGITQVKLPHTWDNFEDADKVRDNEFGNRLRKDRICSSKGKKLINFVKEIFLR